MLELEIDGEISVSYDKFMFTISNTTVKADNIDELIDEGLDKGNLGLDLGSLNDRN